MFYVLLEKRYVDNMRFVKALEGVKSVLTIKKNELKVVFSLEEIPYGERIVGVFGFTMNWIEKALRDLNDIGVHPLVFGARPRFHLIPFSYLTSDYVACFYLIGKYIYKNHPGIKTAVFVGFNPNSPHDIYKLEGFKKAMEENHISFDIYQNDGDSLKMIEELTNNEDKYDYICAGNDTIAALYISNSKTADKKIISGFSANKISHKLPISFLTTSIDYYKSGKVLANLFLFLNKQKEIYPLSVKMPPQLLNNNEILEFDPNYNHEQEIDFFKDKAIEDIDCIEKMLLVMDTTDEQILKMIREGVKYEDIADKLFLSISTVKYRLNLYLKETGVDNKKELFDLLDKYKVVI